MSVVTMSIPRADIFQTVATGSDQFITAVMAVVLGVLAFMLAKWLIQAKTFMVPSSRCALSVPSCGGPTRSRATPSRAR